MNLLEGRTAAAGEHLHHLKEEAEQVQKNKVFFASHNTEVLYCLLAMYKGEGSAVHAWKENYMSEEKLPFVFSERMSLLHRVRVLIFNEQYEEDTLLTVSHKAGFPSEELKNQFMDIMDTHGYTCTCDGEGTVTASRKFFMENGAVVSDILNVANQTCALKGTYQDYEVNC